MKFLKILIALICGFSLWIIIDNPLKKELAEFTKWKNQFQNHPELIGPSESGKWFKLLFTINEKHLKNSRFDLYIENNESFTPSVIQESIHVSKKKAIKIYNTHDYWKPVIKDSNYSDLLKPAQFFRDAGCIVRVKCIELKRNIDEPY